MFVLQTLRNLLASSASAAAVKVNAPCLPQRMACLLSEPRTKCISSFTNFKNVFCMHLAKRPVRIVQFPLTYLRVCELFTRLYLLPNGQEDIVQEDIVQAGISEPLVGKGTGTMALQSPSIINPAVSHITASLSSIMFFNSLQRSGGHQLVRIKDNKRQSLRRGIPKAFFGLENEPVVKEALKEPIAFFGGVFAGLLRLDLNEDPLKEWIERTTEAANVQVEEQESIQEDGPEEIKIE